jgi:hypothetical protein
MASRKHSNDNFKRQAARWGATNCMRDFSVTAEPRGDRTQ